MLYQNVSAGQTQTKPRDETNTAALMAEKQDAANVKPQTHQKQTEMKDDVVTGGQSPAFVERVKQLATKTNWALLISVFAAIFAGLSWSSARKSLEVTHNATKAEFQPYISVPQSIDFDVITPERGDNGDTLVAYSDSIEIKNVGKTPASSINVSAQGKFYKDRRHFDEQALIDTRKTGDMVAGDTWNCRVRFDFDFPDGGAYNFKRIREMDIYITVTFQDMFTSNGTRRYIFHYLCDEVGYGAELQSVEEKTDG